MKRILLWLYVFLCSHAYTQTIGGATVFHFINQPNTAALSALGGVNISSINNTVGLAFHQPALLRKDTEKKYEASFNNFIAGIKNYSFIASHYFQEKNFTAAIGVNYFNYGTITETDAAGNVFGNTNLNDYSIQIQIAKQYKEKWFYGATLKYISSNYSIYKSNGVAVDAGICYYNHYKKLQIGFLVKNIGSQLKTYSNTGKAELPFDMQIGITKKLEKAPLQFSLTAHHLQAFNILYSDADFNTSEGLTDDESTLKKILAHFVLATEIFVGDKIRTTISYNFLRRDDLKTYQSGNGLSGFNLGISVLLKKLHLHYATGFYQQHMYHQMSIGF